MDKKTYFELMNYLIKVECKRMELDRQGEDLPDMSSQKRPSSTMKRPVEKNG